MAINLWLGLYHTRGEWPWTYFFLIVVQLMFVIQRAGRSLGGDALIARSLENGSGEDRSAVADSGADHLSVRSASIAVVLRRSFARRRKVQMIRPTAFRLP